MDSTSLLLCERLDNVLLLTINRPQAANALNTPLAKEIFSAFSTTSPDIRTVVLTGAGTRAFCAGADLKERQGMPEAAWKEQHAHFRAAAEAVRNCPAPVLAAVNGAAFGGGLELALACDFIYTSVTARFALPETSLGIMPGLRGTATLPEAIGTRRAAEYLFTGRVFDAAEAHAMGLVNRVLPAESLLPEALDTAQTIARNAPLAVRAVKRVMHGAEERETYDRLLNTQDRLEGIEAYNTKRAPLFTGS